MNARRLAVVLSAFALAPASASAAPSGPLATQCAPAGSTVVVACYGADAITRDAQDYAQPGRFEPAIQSYEQSWTHRALGLQYALADDVGFVNAPWIGTHNSFNSIAEEGPSVSDTDANQQLGLTDQLRVDVRSLELDVHWFPSARANGQYAPVVCHAGAASEHDGCSTERLLGPVLDEIAGWLKGHPRQVLLLYIEDHLDSGYENAAGIIKSELGTAVYPTGWKTGQSGCVKLPGSLTRDHVLDAGAQVVIVTGCGGAAGWHSIAFDWGGHFEDRPHGYADFPQCGAENPPVSYDTRLVRYFEDSTWLTTAAAQVGQGSVDDGLTPATVRAMTRCGVDLFGFDQLTPGDGRLDAAVWSWAQDQPSARGDCAAIGQDGRWSSGNCKRHRRVACRRADGSWVVPKPAVPERGASTVCADAGAAFAVPRTGHENEALKTAAGGAGAWLGYVRATDGWRALDAR